MTKNKGLTLVHIGDGKGKTTAAVGLAVRAAGAGKRVAFLQFIKGDWPSGEAEIFKKLDNVDVEVLGKGFVGILGDQKSIDEHRAAADEALQKASEATTSDKYDLVVLDEIISAVEEKVLGLEQVVELIKNKRADLHICLTGHNNFPEIVELADLVTEMKMLKHPYYKGILAQEGIDY